MDKLNDKLIEEIHNAGEVKKTLFFYRIAARKKGLWGLYDGDEWRTETFGGKRALLLWPAEEFSRYVPYEEGGFRFVRIDLYAFIKDWVPQMILKGETIAMYGDGDLVYNSELNHFAWALNDTFKRKHGMSIAKDHRLNAKGKKAQDIGVVKNTLANTPSIFRK